MFQFVSQTQVQNYISNIVIIFSIIYCVLALVGYKFLDTKESAYLNIGEPLPAALTFCMRVKADYVMGGTIPLFYIAQTNVLLRAFGK